METIALTIILTRLSALAVGAFCLWLAYKLLLNNTDACSGMDASGYGVKLKMTRIPFGIIFGLFGMAIVVYALKPISYSRTGSSEQMAGSPMPQEEISATTASEQVAGGVRKAPMPQVTPKVAKKDKR
jgi:hypothetical protein